MIGLEIFDYFGSLCFKPWTWLICCIVVIEFHAAVSGVEPVTFNGLNSTANLNIPSSGTNLTVLKFSLKTRRKDCFILGSSNGSFFVGVGLKDGNIIVTSSTGDTIQGNRQVANGLWHNLTVKTENADTSITIDSQVDKTRNVTILTVQWENVAKQKGLDVGITPQTSLYDQFLRNNSFKGCMKEIFIGQNLLELNATSGTSLRSGCHSDNVCSNASCQRGTCKDIFDDFLCQCPSHYTGRTCNQTVNITCAFQPCRNFSDCVNLTDVTLATGKRILSDVGFDMFRCKCIPGYEGYYCQNETNECQPDPCVNGTCTDKHLNYICSCNKGYSGQNCSDNINECLSDPCQNGGNCIDGIASYTCRCPKSFTAINCTEDVNECNVTTNPCKNGATCNNLFGGYSCTCVAGSFGQNCENSPCDSNPCINGGNCTDNNSGYNCTCRDGFTGERCANAINPTSKSCGEQCQNKDPNIIIYIVVGVGLLIIFIVIILLCMYCKGKQGMHGSYSPKRQEKGQTHELTQMPPLPPKERLI